MKFRQFLLITLLAALTACGSNKYPYPPQFVGVDDVPGQVLPVPPAKYSRTYNAEIDEILARQAKLTDAQKAVILEENHIAPEMIVQPVLGKGYTQERYPALYALLKHVGSDAWRISDAAEDFWDTPRPWYADARVALLVPAIRQPGYPSGHTTTNGVWAYVLGDLFPAKREALLKRATVIGYHRVDGGAHFPHDVEGGQELARIIYAHMRANPQYAKELAAVRAEIARPRSEVKSPVLEQKPIPKAGAMAPSIKDEDASDSQESWWSRHVMSVRKKSDGVAPAPAGKPAAKPERHVRRENCIAISQNHATSSAC